MPKRISAGNGPDALPELRVVIVTLDNHLAGAVERARRVLAESAPGLVLGFHAAAEWETDPAALDACRADIARADIVLSAMLFMDEHIQAVLPDLKARRDHCDAMVCAMSAAEVIRLTRMGAYRMDGSDKGPLALQPCYHRTTERIEAHVMLTILAGNCVRYLERHTEMTFRQLSDLFGGLMVAEMADGEEGFWQRGELNQEQERVLERLGMRLPPREWALSIEGLPANLATRKRRVKRDSAE